MDPAIETVHIVFKTHLDVGFTDMPHKVVQKYFDEFIPQSLETAHILREAGGDEQFIWTIGSWLITEYLEKAPSEKAQRLEDAIRAGQITWHAYPFTPHHELLDAGMFKYELSLSKKLDQRFGKRTVAAKLTDVPGDTRATLHHLSQAGIKFLHIGVNKASTLPKVPPICLWQDPSGSQVVLMYHSGYGNVMSSPDQAADYYTGNVTHFPGMKDAIYFAFTLDNRGPHTPETVRGVFADVRKIFPQAKIIASTMDTFAEKLWEVRNRMPVVTDEIGNTWIHGGGADPGKLSRFRALSRLRAGWLEQGKVSPEDPAFERFSRRLLLIPEHTWGLNESRTLDHNHWNPEQLKAVWDTPPYQRMEQSWEEARAYVGEAVAELSGSLLAHEAETVLLAAEPKPATIVGSLPEPDFQRVFDTDEFQIGFDPETGAVNHLLEKRSGRQWADAQHPWGWMRHQSFDATDWVRFFRQYIICNEDWVSKDFGKPNIDQAGAVSTYRSTWLQNLHSQKQEMGMRFVVEMSMSEIPPTRYGLPEQVTLELFFPKNKPVIEWDVQWFNKAANRLPEAYWFSFCPINTDPEGWMMEKIDCMISPLQVVSMGGRNLHGVNRGVFYRYEGESLSIETLDAGIVAPGEPKLLNLDDRLPDLTQGWHFNLWNNKWGCNFPTWYSDDARFRFKTSFGS